MQCSLVIEKQLFCTALAGSLVSVHVQNQENQPVPFADPGCDHGVEVNRSLELISTWTFPATSTNGCAQGAWGPVFPAFGPLDARSAPGSSTERTLDRKHQIPKLPHSR